MPIQRSLLALVAIAAAAAVAGSPLSDSMGLARRGLKNSAKELDLQSSSVSRAVRNALKHAVKAAHRPEDRSLISLPGQTQTVRTLLTASAAVAVPDRSSSLSLLIALVLSSSRQYIASLPPYGKARCTQGDHPIIPGPLAPPVNFAQAGTEAQTVNYAALPNPTTLPNPITICPDGILMI